MNTIVDVLCPAKEATSPVRKITTALIWPLRGEQRTPEHIEQPIQRQMRTNKYMVQVEIHASIKPPMPEVSIKLQVPSDLIRQPTTTIDPNPG